MRIAEARCEDPGVGRIALFAYASLVNAESAARTLGRPPRSEPQPAQLRGWRRRWSQARDNRTCEKTFARTDNGEIPRHVLGLNIERADAAKVDFVAHGATNAPIGANGMLIELTDEELERLDVRELRYDRTEVSGDVVLSADVAPRAPAFDRIVTYIAKPAHFAPEPPTDAVILAPYVVAVEAAFAGLGEDQLDLYRETTDPPPVEVIEATLVRDRIPPGNPRAW